LRICFFGDSFVLGQGDDDTLGWVGRLIALERRAGFDLTGYNLGVRGETTADIAARWESEARPRLLAKHVGRLVFSFGANDCCPNEQGARKLEHQQSLQHAEAILRAAKGWLPTLMVGPGIIADDPAATERVIALSKDLSALCARLEVPFFDLPALLLATPSWSEEARAADGAHPNRGGYARVAEAIAAWPAWRALTSAAARP
jgi:acyl-CoA thioesterase-1